MDSVDLVAGADGKEDHTRTLAGGGVGKRPLPGESLAVELKSPAIGQDSGGVVPGPLCLSGLLHVEAEEPIEGDRSRNVGDDQV